MSTVVLAPSVAFPDVTTVSVIIVGEALLMIVVVGMEMTVVGIVRVV